MDHCSYLYTLVLFSEHSDFLLDLHIEEFPQVQARNNVDDPITMAGFY